ncbi:MAG: glycoside hydrolase family 18 protein [Gammaproteobacteria bacterium]|nr:MAG: glycoside hydrolase family 18 protein [Gammaproteobacteria bacterium]UTW43844.1 glycoside hydrolase family 18 protein [bacterium SCSIO 12844]
MNKIIKLCAIAATSLTLNTTYAAEFSLPQASSFYPIYNSGKNQYIPPTTDMPFDQISTLYIAFAHAYPQGNAAVLDFEHGQDQEQARLKDLIQIARKMNPNIKFIISLGWGYQFNDWGHINDDYESGANQFPNSVVQFIRENDLDGFDIDDESVTGISQANFDAVVKNIRIALNNASVTDNKAYYFTITPAFGLANVNRNNKDNFDMINVQNYGGSSAGYFINIGVDPSKISVGIDSEGCHAYFPDNTGLAGIFNWTLSADSNCGDYKYTHQIAHKVGY